MIACASTRAPGKADNSPFPELFALRRIVSRQMCVKRFKAVGMPYDNASSIASLPSCENDRTGSGGMDRCGQLHCHIDSRMKTMFSRYGMNPASIRAAYPELVFQGT